VEGGGGDSGKIREGEKWANGMGERGGEGRRGEEEEERDG